jgi:xanthine dehydrogenase accessory factor
VRQREVYDAIQRYFLAGTPAVLATVVRVRGSAPGSLGSKMVVTPSGESVGTVGGGCVDGQVFAEAKKVLEDERPRTITIDLTENEDPDHGLICGGKVEVFLEPLVAANLYICGAGHIGHALAPIARKLDFRVTVIDDRARFLSEERFPGCERIVAPFEEVLPKLATRKPAYVTVVTRGHTYDQECLEWGLRQDARYVGLVGSKVKIRKILARASEAGYPPERLAAVRAPIGLDVGAVTVEEIAVAIAAELVAVRRLGARISRRLASVEAAPGNAPGTIPAATPCESEVLPPK